jgi:anti-sigma factor RsiW
VNEQMHSEVRGLYSAYVDHELPAPELERFVAHVESCEDCLHGLEDFEATVEAVRGVARERAPSTFTRAVLRRVKHRSRRQASVLPFLDGTFHLPAEVILPVVLAAAIALLIHALQ